MDPFSMRRLQTSLRHEVWPEYQVIIRNINQSILRDLEGFKEFLRTNYGAMSFEYHDDEWDTHIVAGFDSQEKAHVTIQDLHQQKPDYLELTYFKGNQHRSPVSSMAECPSVSGLGTPFPRGTVLGRGKLRGAPELSVGRAVSQSGPVPCFRCGRPSRVCCESCLELFCSSECLDMSTEHDRICPPQLPALPLELPTVPCELLVTPRGYQSIPRDTAYVASPPAPYGMQPTAAIPGNQQQPFVDSNWSRKQHHAAASLNWSGPQQHNQMPQWQSPPQQAYPGQQPPQQAYPGQQPLQQAYPGQQPPQQAYPAQQPPQQAYPAQQPPQQAYPAQQRPQQAYPGQQPLQQAYPGQQPPQQAYPAQHPPQQAYLAQQPPQQAYPGQQPPQQSVYPPPPSQNRNPPPGQTFSPPGPKMGFNSQGPPDRSNYQPISQQQESGARPRQQFDQLPKQDADRRQFREGNQEHCKQFDGHRDGFKPGNRVGGWSGGPPQQEQHGFRPNQGNSGPQQKRSLLPNLTSPPKTKEDFNKSADNPRFSDNTNAFKFKPRDRQYDGGNVRQNTNDKSTIGGIQAKFNKGPERNYEPRGNFNTSPRKPEFSTRNDNRTKQSVGQAGRTRTESSVSEEWDQDEETSTPVSYGTSYSKGSISVPGELVEVAMTWICSPEEIFVQLNIMEEEVNAVNVKLAASVAKAPPVQNVVVGLPCAAPYEGTWFRGRVTKVLGDGFLAVFFVDYGNTEKISRGSVKQLEQGLCAAPLYAVELELVDVKPVQVQWGPDASNFVAGRVTAGNLTLKLVEKKPNGKIVADLLIDGKKSLSEMMVAEGVARSAKPQSVPVEGAVSPPKNSVTPVQEQPPAKTVTMATAAAADKAEILSKKVPAIAQDRTVAPGKAWVGILVSASDIRVQCVTDEVQQDVEKVTAVLEEADLANKPRLNKPVEVGEFYACLFEDGSWYRAKVKGKTADKFQMYLIDYGNDYETSVETMRELPSELLDIAPCCSKLQLNRVDVVPDGVVDQVKAILEPLVDEYVDIKVVAKEIGAVAVVEVDHNDVSINDAVLNTIASSVTAAAPAIPAAAPAPTIPAAVSAAIPAAVPAAIPAAAPAADSAAETPASEPDPKADVPRYSGEEWTCVKAIYKSSEVATLPLNQQVEIVILNGSEAPFFIHFCLFDVDFFEKLAELHGEIFEYCRMPLPPYKPDPFEVCLVEHPEEEGGWGRGCRVDKDDETFFYLLDKGEGVVVQPDRVRRIPGKFLSLPYAAHSGVLKGYENVSEESVDAGVVSKLKGVLKTGANLEATIIDATPWVLDIPKATAALHTETNN